MNQKLDPNESSIIGSWFMKNGKMCQDGNCKRIQWLISEYLNQIAVDESDWCILYKNPFDNSYWELTYPQSHMHGGGPPSLFKLTREEAKFKYNI